MDKRSVVFRFWRTKTHWNGGHWVEVEFVEADEDRLCGVSLLRQLFDRLQLWTQFTASVFPKVSRARWEKSSFEVDISSVYSKKNWIKKLRQRLHCLGFNPLEFSGHGFRAGGATDLFEAGVSLVAIMEFGRWKTAEACLRYYRKSAHLASRVARAFVSSDIGSGRMEHTHRKRGVVY